MERNIRKWESVITATAKNDLLQLKDEVTSHVGTPFLTLLQTIQSKAAPVETLHTDDSIPAAEAEGNDLTKCTICTSYSFTVRKTSLSAQEKAKLLLEWETHKIRIGNDRRDYKFRCLLSVNQPSKYCSMIHDGMCKMRTKLPLNNDHRSKKVEDNDRMFCGLNLAIVHQKDGPHNTTTVGFFSPASCYDTTTNSIISRLMHTLSCLPLVPPTVFIQVDNFPGNKSYLFFGAFGYLLLRQKAIKEFYISFMQPGHTHCDVDARFGNFSTFLNSRECGSPQELISAFKECIPGQALMKQTIYDFKSVLTQYCEKYGTLKSMYDFLCISMVITFQWLKMQDFIYLKLCFVVSNRMKKLLHQKFLKKKNFRH
jgi:hypothetical protein